jgi:hypothetical protein
MRDREHDEGRRGREEREATATPQIEQNHAAKFGTKALARFEAFTAVKILVEVSLLGCEAV